MDWFLGQTVDGNGDVVYFLETDGERMTRDLNNPATDNKYYLLRTTPGNTVTKKALLKPPPRAPAGALEIAVVEADGSDVADAEVKV